MLICHNSASSADRYSLYIRSLILKNRNNGFVRDFPGGANFRKSGVTEKPGGFGNATCKYRPPSAPSPYDPPLTFRPWFLAVFVAFCGFGYRAEAQARGTAPRYDSVYVSRELSAAGMSRVGNVAYASMKIFRNDTAIQREIDEGAAVALYPDVRLIEDTLLIAWDGGMAGAIIFLEKDSVRMQLQLDDPVIGADSTPVLLGNKLGCSDVRLVLSRPIRMQ